MEFDAAALSSTTSTGASSTMSLPSLQLRPTTIRRSIPSIGWAYGCPRCLFRRGWRKGFFPSHAITPACFVISSTNGRCGHSANGPQAPIVCIDHRRGGSAAAGRARFVWPQVAPRAALLTKAALAEKPLNDNQRAIITFSQYLESQTKDKDANKVKRSMQMMSGPVDQVGIAKQRAGFF